jgi:hypothetical protein
VAASRNAAQTVYPTPKSPNLFPQKCDRFCGSQAIHCNHFLHKAEDSTSRLLFVSFAVSSQLLKQFPEVLAIALAI